jgi:hypothetical protein
VIRGDENEIGFGNLLYHSYCCSGRNSLVGAVSIIGPNIPAAYANDNQFCTHIQEYDEDGTPTIGSDCWGKMKDCRNDAQGLDKCVKDDKFVYP